MKIKIETERLTIFPLTYEQVEKYTKEEFLLEDELKLDRFPRKVSLELKGVIEPIILPLTKAHPEDFQYYTLWLIVDKTKNIIVGGFDFKASPDDQGLVEIGYGIEPPFFKKGYMTEAIAGIIKWAKTIQKIRIIFAETEISNIASQNVLKSNRFVQIANENNLIQWQLNI